MELKIEIQNNDKIAKIRKRINASRSRMSFDEKEEDMQETIKYHTREAYIQPLNEHTLKKRKLKEDELDQLKKQKELDKKAALEQKMRIYELNEKQRKKEEEEELRIYKREKRHIEELEELEKLVS